MERHLTGRVPTREPSAPACVRPLTRGRGLVACQRCRSLVSPGCTPIRRRAAERSSCVLLGGS